MINRRTQLLALLARPTLPEARKPKIKRLLWVITGAVDHGISLKRLFKVSKTYERIAMVPKDYMQAELYLQTEEPQHMQNLKARISEHKNKQSAVGSPQDAAAVLK